MHGMMRAFLTLPPEKIKYLKREKWIIEEIQRRTKTKIVLEDEGRVVIEPGEGSTSLDLMKAKEVLMAIGYGFDPDTAFLLFNDMYVMETIDVKDLLFDHHDERALKRMLGRVIGKHGKAKRNLEEIGHVKISITKDKIAIIGEYENVEAVKDAIGELLEGKMHATVYRRLEFRMRGIRRGSMLKYWEEGL